jgi:photosystem II stability/assembly factor-like uncharacterized protein
MVVRSETLWTITGILVPLALGVALAMIGLPQAQELEFGIARACLGLAAALLGGATIFWLSTTEWSDSWRISIGALIGAVVLAGTVEGFRFLGRREAIARPQAYEPLWGQVDLTLDFDSPNPPKEFPNGISWRDISWVSGSLGWISGAISEGGGRGEVGIGILLARGRGDTWRVISNERFKSGNGTFTWGPRGGRQYRWDDVGPINAIRFYKGAASKRGIEIEGWAATATGVYRTIDGGETWDRSTPSPNSPERYALYGNFIDIDAFVEIYAVGWQGITHWNELSGWELQLPTYYYNIASIASWGGLENRRVWAVGRSGQDKLGFGDQSHGAIYSLAPDGRTWIKIELDNVNFQKGQSLNDIAVSDATVVAVGDKGLVVRGVRTSDGTWRFDQRASPTTANLYSVARLEPLVYAVGEKGTILYSRDDGLTWHTSSKITDKNNQERDVSSQNLRRVRFNTNDGTAWIVGDGIVLKNRSPQSGIF